MSDAARSSYGSGLGIFVAIFGPVQLFSQSIWQSAWSVNHH